MIKVIHRRVSGLELPDAPVVERETMTFNLEIARANAARGAAELDVRRPGWHDEIDTARLNMMIGYSVSSSPACVLCQLDQVITGAPEGDWWMGKDALFGDMTMTDIKLEELGFCLPPNDEDFALLDIAWIKEIEERRERSEKSYREEPIRR